MGMYTLMESSLMHTRLIDVQALKNQLNKSYAEPFSKNAKNTDFALKIQAPRSISKSA